MCLSGEAQGHKSSPVSLRDLQVSQKQAKKVYHNVINAVLCPKHPRP